MKELRLYKCLIVIITLQTHCVQLSFFHVSPLFLQMPSESMHLFPLCFPLSWQWCSSLRIFRRSCLIVFWNSSNAVSIPSILSSSTSFASGASASSIVTLAGLSLGYEYSRARLERPIAKCDTLLLHPVTKRNE